MKLSIVTVNLNNAAGLQRTIESVICQSFRDMEYLVIDGGSVDSSRGIIENYSNRLAYWTSEKDGGVYFAQNKGILQAKGEYLLFLNSGDVLAGPNVIDELISGEDGQDLIYGNMIQEFPDGSRRSVSMPDVISADFLFDKTLCHPATLIRRELFALYGLYDTDLKIVADWAFFLKVIFIYGATYVHRNVCVSIFRMDGMSASLSNQHFIKAERNQVMSSIFPPVLQDLIVERNEIKRYYNRFRLKELVRLIDLLRSVRASAIELRRDLTRKVNYPLRTMRSRLNLKNHVEKLDPECRNIPIIINNRNHLSYLKRLISSLEIRGYFNLYILDNDSDFPELISYYNSCPYEVIRLGKNLGYCALWDSPVFKRFEGQFYIYTDSDLELVEECPAHFVAVLRYYLERYPSAGKAGLSIVTKDLPSHYALKDQVIEMEMKNSAKRLEEFVYDARVDTTFALYRPDQFGDALKLSAIRIAFPYSVRHLPWYEKSTELGKEQQHYYLSADRNSYWGTLLKQEGNYLLSGQFEKPVQN